MVSLPEHPSVRPPAPHLFSCLLHELKFGEGNGGGLHNTDSCLHDPAPVHSKRTLRGRCGPWGGGWPALLDCKWLQRICAHHLLLTRLANRRQPILQAFAALRCSLPLPQRNAAQPPHPPTTPATASPCAHAWTHTHTCVGTERTATGAWWGRLWGGHSGCASTENTSSGR